MNLTGTLKHVSAVTKNDKGYDNQYIIVAIDETTQYPQQIKMEVGKKLIGTINEPVGGEVSVDYNLRGSGYTNKKTGEPDAFSALSVWRIVSSGNGSAQSATATQGQANNAASYAPNATPPDNADSLPF